MQCGKTTLVYTMLIVNLTLTAVYARFSMPLHEQEAFSRDSDGFLPFISP